MIQLTDATLHNERAAKRKLLRFIAKAQKLSFGEECKKFEHSFALWQKRKDAVFMNSGSSANFALFQALLNLGRLRKGDRVAFSAVTWSTNVTPLISLGLEPIPMDVRVETLNSPSTEVQRVIKEYDVKAVFITNLLGLSNDLTAIKAVCEKHNIMLLEDNCESLGSMEGKVKLGNFGLASTFSFFVGHHMSTIEGGAVCTDNRDLAEALRITRAHGWDRHLEKNARTRLRKKHDIDEFYGSYTFYDVGHNFRPTEISGFIGNITLPSLHSIVKVREKIFSFFEDALVKRPDAYYPLRHSHLRPFSAFALPVVCRNIHIKKKLIASCRNKIEIRPIVGGNMIQQPFFKKYIAEATETYRAPNAALIHALGLYLPLRPDLTLQEQRTIRDTLAQV